MLDPSPTADEATRLLAALKLVTAATIITTAFAIGLVLLVALYTPWL